MVVLDDGRVLNPREVPVIQVQAKMARGASVKKPAQLELLMACGDSLAEIVSEASPHKEGDRKVLMEMADSGEVTIAVKHAKNSGDFGDACMEREQIAVSCFLRGAGAMRATRERGNPVSVVDDDKNFHVVVSSVDALAQLINAKARACGDEPPIGKALIMRAQQESDKEVARGR